MSTSFDITNCPGIVEWLDKHPKLANLFSFEICPDDESAQAAKQKAHEKLVSQFSTLIRLLQREKSEAMDLFTKISQEKLRKVGNLGFDDMRHVTLARKITFCYHQLQRWTAEHQSMKLDMLLEREEDAQSMLSFITSDTIPKDCTCVVDTAFFFVNMPSKLSKLGFKIDAMTGHLKRLEQDLHEAPTPLWATSLKEYVNRSVVENQRFFEEELFYVRPLDCEVAISKAIFGGFNPNISKAIDEMLEDEEQCNGESSGQIVTKISALIPRPEGESEEACSVRMFILFRLLFNRLYEKTNGNIIKSTDQELEKITHVMKLKSGNMVMPNEFAPPALCEEAPLRERFLQSRFFIPAIQFLEQIEYSVNPLDALFSIHKCLLAINKSAMLTKADGREVSAKELTNLLSFDDLFALLIGVFTATDVPELFAIGRFISRFTPRSCLSNAFEYAEAGIESLVFHLQNMN